MHRNREKKSYLRRIGSVLLALAVMACTVQISERNVQAADGYVAYSAVPKTLTVTRNLTIDDGEIVLDSSSDNRTSVSLDDVESINIMADGVSVTFDGLYMGHSSMEIGGTASNCSITVTRGSLTAKNITGVLVNNHGVISCSSFGKSTIWENGSPVDYPCVVDNYYSISVGSADVLQVINHEYGYFNVTNGLTATEINNENEISCGTLSVEELNNTGKIKGGGLTIPEDTTSSESAVYEVLEWIEIEKSISNFGTIQMQSASKTIKYYDTEASLPFKLKIGADGTPKDVNIYTKNGQPTSYTAGYLMKDDPDFDWTAPTILAGVDYNPLRYLTTNSDGAVTVVKYYKDDGDLTPLSAKPTTPGNYAVQIKIAETSTYRDSDQIADFEIKYLESSDDPSLPYRFSYEQTPAVNRDPYYYYNTPLTMTAPDGYEICLSEDDLVFKKTVTITEDGYYNGVQGRIRRTSDKAYTAVRFLNGEASYLDQKAPWVKTETVLVKNGTGETPVIKDGAIIRGTYMEFDITDMMTPSDASLESVTVNGTSIPIENYREYAHVTLTANQGVKTYRILALDKTHNQLAMTISLDGRKDVTALKLLMGDAIYGASYSDPIVETESNATDYAFYYKKKGADESTYSKEKPTEVGEYDVKAEIPATDLYQAATATTTFAIVKQELHPTISMGTCLVGTAFSPTVTDLPEDAQVSILYKQADAGEDAWTADLPSAPGTYTVKASVEAGATYEATAVTTDFDLTWLEAPKTTYTPTGIKGNGGYYTTDLYLTAPEGFEIASPEGEFGAKLLYSDGLKTYRLRRVEDGALTGELTLTEEFKVDKDAPRTGAAVDQDGKLTELVDGMSIYAGSLSFTILDDHLAKVTVDGKPVEITNHQAKILLEVGKRKKSFTVVAEDEAGNTYTYHVTLKAPWMEHRYIPAGSPIPLEAGQSYTFGEGHWIVEGDTTVYSGGMRFYVKNDGDYTFEQTQ